MTDAATGAALLRAILDDPADDLPRLAYADWCDENGQPERAGFVRVQLEIARPLRCHYSTFDDCLDRREDIDDVIVSGCPACAGRCRLLLRQTDLFRPGVVFDPLDDALPGRPAEIRAADARFVTELIAPPEWDGEAVSYVWRRGFVGRVELPLAAWREHGPELVRQHPLTRVELTDRQPVEAIGCTYWLSSGGHVTGSATHAHYLPYSIWRRLRRATTRATRFKGYPQPCDALDAASDALLAWASAQPARIAADSAASTLT